MSSFRRRAVGLVQFAAAQFGIQAAGFVAGILIVRAIDKSQYAQYAIITSIIAAIVMVSDSGVTSVLMSRGAKVRSDRIALGQLMSVALRYRRYVAIPTLVLADAGLLFLLTRNGASWFDASLYTVIVSVIAWPLLTKGVMQVELRLNAKYRSIQTIGVQSALGRSVLVALLYFAGLGHILFILLITLASAIFESFRFRSVASQGAELVRGRVAGEERSAFLTGTRQTLPMTLLLVAQGQLLYLLLGTLGSTDVVAEIAALSRYSVLFVVANVVIAEIGSGAVARYAGTMSEVIRTMARVLLGYVAIATVLVIAASAAGPILLWLLGSGYEGLESELLIVVTGSAAISLGTAMKVLNQSRGWIRGSWTFIPFTAAWCAMGIFVFDLTKIHEAAVWMAAQAIPGILTQIVCAFLAIRGGPQAQRQQSVL